MDPSRNGLDKALAVVMFAITAILCVYLFNNEDRLPVWGPNHSQQTPRVFMRPSAKDGHPIDRLMSQGSKDFHALNRKRTKNINEAAATYRTHRGRHPPPGFDKWYSWARNKNAVIIEDMFDQIYEDLEPFWALSPSKLRRQIETWPVLFMIRNGTVGKRQAGLPVIGDWIGRWEDLLNQIPSEGLPDVDLAINTDDEPHLFVPWADINELMKIALKTRTVEPPSESHKIIDRLSRFPPMPEASPIASFPDAPLNDTVWELIQMACPPGSPVRKTKQDEDFSTVAEFPSKLNHMPEGYVDNFTAARYVCDNPHLCNIHGYMINSKLGSYLHFKGEEEPYPDDRMNTRILFPLFSTTKIRGVNNDILIPAAMYWGNYAFGGQFSYDDNDAVPWASKVGNVTWRGASSGGVGKEETWTRFHRYRFASMLNSTQVAMAEDVQGSRLPDHVPTYGNPPMIHNFPLPDPKVYSLSASSTKGGLGKWVGSFANVAFTYVKCWPSVVEFANQGKSCPYTDTFFHTTPTFDIMEFFKSKYLPDLDGASFSGRWRAYLMSASLPIKATIWSEWHDARLIPWKHFVPMDNTYMDWWGIIEYFLGYSPPDGRKSGNWRPSHDYAAKMIAEEGRDWSHLVLREEDMVLYFWRVILEYARICDDRRLMMGWVDDLQRQQ